MREETKCLHAGYTPKNGEPRVVPICQSTTYLYESTDEVGALFDLTKNGYFYSRIANPTVCAVEDKIAALEGGVGALCTTSGQSANLLAVLNICSAGDSIISAPHYLWRNHQPFRRHFKASGYRVYFRRSGGFRGRNPEGFQAQYPSRLWRNDCKSRYLCL